MLYNILNWNFHSYRMVLVQTIPIGNCILDGNTHIHIHIYVDIISLCSCGFVFEYVWNNFINKIPFRKWPLDGYGCAYNGSVHTCFFLNLFKLENSIFIHNFLCSQCLNVIF